MSCAWTTYGSSKDLLYGELVQGKRPTGRPQLRFKDVCKRDLKALNIDQNNLKSNSPQTVSLETDCAEKSLQLRRDARSVTQRKENEKKGCSHCRQASVRLRLCPLPQGLSFPHRTGQPHSTLYQNKHLERNSIVFRD